MRQSVKKRLKVIHYLFWFFNLNFNFDLSTDLEGNDLEENELKENELKELKEKLKVAKSKKEEMERKLQKKKDGIQ